MDNETKTYIALSAVMFLEYGIWGAWAPVLAARLLGPLKMTGKQTGWIYATLPVACVFSPLVAGWLADQFLNTEWILGAAHAIGAVLLIAAARQQQFKPLLIIMFLYSVCFAATMPLVNSALFAAVDDVDTRNNVFIWAPLAWALVGWTLTGWRMMRTSPGDGSDCLKFSAALSVVMAVVCFTMLPATPPVGSGEIPLFEALAMLSNMNFLVFIILSMVIAGLMQFYFLGTAQFLQDMGVSSKHVPASMALAQIFQAAATVLLLGWFLENLGFKWTLTAGAGCWLVMYGFYILGKPRRLMIGIQPLHGFAFVFFIIGGQICADAYATPAIRSSIQALIFAATMGVGMFFGTQLAGFVMDKNSKDGAFDWPKVWQVPFAIVLVGVLGLAVAMQEPPAQQPAEPPAENAEVAALDGMEP